MRRPFSSSQKGMSRPGHGASGSNNNNNSNAASHTAGAAAVSAWVRPRLLNTATQLLTLHPDDPLRVMGAHFAMEALILASYPETSMLSLEEGEEYDDDDVVASLRTSPSPTSPLMKSTSASGWKAKAASGRGDMRRTTTAFSQPSADHLLEHSWARHCLHPYGLRAVARGLCAVPSTSFSSSSLAMDSKENKENAVAAGAAAQHQWMESFALLHRQSRLSAAERMAATRCGVQVNGAAQPPVDFRAAEELPVSLAVLYAMSVVEGHLRIADGVASSSDDAPVAAFACRRVQLSVKLMGLQLFASFMQYQEREMSPISSSSTSADNIDAAQGDTATFRPSAPSSTNQPPSLLDLLLRLPPGPLEQFHRWLTQRLRHAASGSADAAVQGVEMASVAATSDTQKDRTSVEAADPMNDLSALQSRVLRVFCSILDQNDLAAGVHVATRSSVAIISIDAFVAVMQRIAALVAAHQATATSMAITLSERVGRGTVASNGCGADRLRWVSSLLQSCTAYIIKAGLQRDKAPPLFLPPVWRMYVKRVMDAVAPFQIDARLAPSACVKASLDVTDGCLTTFVQAFSGIQYSVLVGAMVSDWVSRAFALYLVNSP